MSKARYFEKENLIFPLPGSNLFCPKRKVNNLSEIYFENNIPEDFDFKLKRLKLYA
jgi:hypothetical protein